LAQGVLRLAATPKIPIITITSTIYLPVTLVYQRDARGNVVRVITVYGSYDTYKAIASGQPVDLSRLEDIVKYSELAQKAGINPLDVIYTYVPPPPPYSNIQITPPPQDPSLRRFWERNTLSALQILADVNARRRMLLDYLARVRPQLQLRVGTDKADRIIAYVQDRASKAQTVWDLYQVEQLVSDIDRLAALNV